MSFKYKTVVATARSPIVSILALLLLVSCGGGGGGGGLNQDKVGPVISISGSTTINHEQGQSYNDTEPP